MAVSTATFRRPKALGRSILIYSLALLFATYLLAPFLWEVITSVMTEQEAQSVPPHWIPQQPTLDNYIAFVAPTGRQAVAGGRGAQNTPRALLNSTIVALAVTAVNLGVGAGAAYPFARIRFRGANALLLFYLASRMVPGIVIIATSYAMMQSLGLLDTLLALVLTHTVFTLPFSIWLLRSYFSALPREIDDAALIDGCNWLQMMLRVFLPLSAPGLTAVGMFSFMSSWSEFLFALILTSSMASKTIPVVVSEFVTDINTDYTFLAASGVITVIPPVLLALFFQRWIVQGLVAGSVKQ